jgi:hypothetical protein
MSGTWYDSSGTPRSPNQATSGADSFTGTSGNNAASGAGGNDTLSGEGGIDYLAGGNADDVLIGGTGNDILFGGEGNDSVVWESGDGSDLVILGNGADTLSLEGWTGPGQGGWTTLPGAGGTGSGTVLFIRGADTISVVGLDANDVITCYAEGTLIATARGEVAVEDLLVGDLVVAAHGGAPLQPVVWIGHSKVNVARQRNRAAAAPILIKACALAEGVPHRDLRVSPEHAMFLDGRLVPAKHLVNGTTIIQELWCPEVTYWHVELPAHGLLVAEGAVSESYFDDGNRKHFDNGAIATLFKDFESERHNGRYAEAACYPLLNGGEALDRLRARLDARAAAVQGQGDRRTA